MDTNFKLSRRSLYIGGYAAAIVLLPWSLKLASYALLVMSIGGLLSNDFNEKRKQVKQHPEVLWFLLLFLIYMTGLLYTSNFYQGIKSLEQKLSLLIIPIIAATSISYTETERKRALLLFALSIAVFTITCFAYNVFLVLRNAPYMQLNFDPHTLARFNQFHSGTHPAWLRFSYIAFSNSWLEPAYLSLYLTFSTLILLFYKPRSKKLAVLNYVMIAWFLVSIVLLASRMGVFLFTLLCTLSFTYLLYTKKISMSRIAIAVLCFWSFIAALIFVFPVTHFRLIDEPLSTPMQIPANANEWNSLNLRLLEWRSSLQSIRENVLVGTGTGGASNELAKQYEQVELGDFKYDYDSHNQYIETYLEIGIPGFVTLLLCLIVSFKFAVVRKNGLLFSLVTMMSIAFLSASMLERGRGIIFFMLFLSLFMFTNHSIEVKTDEYTK